jgi:DNA polymerase III delta subunit
VPILIIDGDDDFLVERAAREEAISFLSENESLEFFLPNDSDSLQEYLNTPSFQEERRSVIIHGASSIPDFKNDDLLIFTKIGQKFDTLNYKIVTIRSPKNENETLQWILKEGGKLNIDLTRVAHALFVSCGSCLRKIVAEIEKISVVTQQGSVVTPEEAKSVLCFSAELRPVQMLESILEGNSAKVLVYFDKFEENNDIGWILSYMHRHVSQALQYRKFPDSKVSFLVKELSTKMKSLSSSVDTFCELDGLFRSGKPSARLGLSFELVRMAEEIKNVKSGRQLQN